MAETEWREVLSFSQRELGKSDKEKLCEGLSWIEVDDIELNFSDLKTLFRLAQDILKYKSEQVNSLLGKLENLKRTGSKKKSKSQHLESPASTESVLDTKVHQEELIKANKEILEQLYMDIAELEGRKSMLKEDGINKDDSDSSRDALSEMNALLQLENEVVEKNKHIRKLLSDVKILEEENTKFKEKIAVLKDKLTEATLLIDNLTEQLLHMSNEVCNLKDTLGKSEQAKAKLSYEAEALRKQLFEKESSRQNIFEEIKSKVQHWKNIARKKKSEMEALSIENEKLKEDLTRASKASSPKKSYEEDQKLKELQDKLTEASKEIDQSANLITLLRAENRQLKNLLEETQDLSTSENRNESDEGKERILINKLKKKVKSLSVSLKEAEEMITIREKELAEIATELQLAHSDDGINVLIGGLKHKKREIKVKDEEIKSLVQEINNLSQLVNKLELENETLRQKCNIPASETIETNGVVKKYRDLERSNLNMCKDIRRLENKLVNLELENRRLNKTNKNLSRLLYSAGYEKRKIEDILQENESDDSSSTKDQDGEAETPVKQQPEQSEVTKVINSKDAEIKEIMAENEGLRKGLQEILDFLKDNSTTSSGILALECPSLEALLRSMEARHAAGWFSPHMSTIMELRAAMGGKDALLTALHEARKETFDVMSQLSKEAQKSSDLERKLQDMKITEKTQENVDIDENITKFGEFGSWMADRDSFNIELGKENQFEQFVTVGNSMYEAQLKKGLEYFHHKFKSLYNKINSMAVQAADDQNKWSLQEEKYIAQVENLKGKVQLQEDEDISENSPGLISLPNPIHLQRKCIYLEESYKYIRTLNENIKNENMEAKKEMMSLAFEYETEIQRLVLVITNLTDKLRSSIPIEMFMKLNNAFNENIIKYRRVIENTMKNDNDSPELFKRLEQNNIEIIERFGREINKHTNNENKSTENVLSYIAESVLKKQIQELCIELNSKEKKIGYLENKITELHENQSKIIDNSLASLTKQEIELMNVQLQALSEENRMLKEKSQHVSNQLDVALFQLQEIQQCQMSNEMEVNLLRHQVLDLQSTSDNKAVVARMSGEVLVAHLQVTESNKIIERLNSTLNREKELRAETEEMLKTRQKVFDVYSSRYESKFRYMFEVMQVLRQQYQGGIPLTSIENYLNKMEDVTRDSQVVNAKLQEIEDLRANLMTKHAVFDQILDVSRNKCIIEEDSCPHKIKTTMMKSTQVRDLDHLNRKLTILEQSRDEILKQYNHLEKTLLLLTQGLEKPKSNGFVDRKHSDGEINVSNLEVEDAPSDDDSTSRKSKTITLPKPQVSKSLPENIATIHSVSKTEYPGLPPTDNITGHEQNESFGNKTSFANAMVQTVIHERETKHTAVQTTQDKSISELKQKLILYNETVKRHNKELSEALSLVQQRTKENLDLSTEKINLEAYVHTLKSNIIDKERLNEKLQFDIAELRNELDQLRTMQKSESKNIREAANNENKSLLLALKQLEIDKNATVAEYKVLLNNEREEYSKTLKDLNVKNMELLSKLDRKGSDSNGINNEALKEVVSKYTMKIVELEDKCFKLQSELEECTTELKTYQSEVDRWKDLATERLVKMEQLNSQFGERHYQEVESYKAENQHWLSQLNDTQREHMELRSRLTEQKALYVKQLSEKDAQIEQMRSVINSLKTQVLNMQTVISVNDPSFDLSAIVEVDEVSDAISHHGSDRLEIKFDCSGDYNDTQDDFGRIGNSSTSIWHESVVERLRRDKQLVGKQNGMLRRQLKALASRERRARLDAQNLRNQVFRITTSGSRVATAETAALHNKIASLQAQLISARRDTTSSIALWDKWKRAQQAAERWQARFEEKCQEVKKLEASLNLSKSAVQRLDREKRMLISRLTQEKSDNQLSIEKQESEGTEKVPRSNDECSTCKNAPPLSNHALLERVQAQQRRIVALEVAEKGNELLVSEYEKALAENTSLKGQVLKLESTLLESQIRSPFNENKDAQPELDYWKNYCEMLKQENVQLNIRMNALESAPAPHSAHQHRINDLEQTILTLRGLVSKLQSEQKSGIVTRKVDSRPNSAKSGSTDKTRGQVESYRMELSNLKRTIQEKDLLLERSKEMLKIAAEREDDLLRENAFLRRQLEELTNPKQGFSSA